MNGTFQLKLLESVRRIFFWGGDFSGSKISWVKWAHTCLPYGAGGLNIGSLKGKNIALLGSSIEDYQIDFKKSFIKTIGDGKSNSFWKENWCGSQCFKDMFPRLYMLESNKDASVSDRVSRRASPTTGSNTITTDNAVAATVQSSVLSDTSANPVTPDATDVASVRPNPVSSCYATWAWWNLANNGIFTVKKLSTLIDSHLLGNPSGLKKTLRNNLVPKKIEIFMWRTRCPICDNDLESVDHSLINCKFASDVWSRIHKWWSVGPCSSSNFDLLEGDLARSSSILGQQIWQGVVWVCAYYLWKNRNFKVFHSRFLLVRFKLNRLNGSRVILRGKISIG
ncbi:uncharacterized protein [Rutidosis leptorrhynchoides]|uniref:uncharacterized protein n=1 Tax=Rutidosis leptorrhynchoides TaxID=125765 RepID=UPI003A98DA7A